MNSNSFDAILIGTGQAAPALANRLTAAGMTVAIIERGHVGGTCVNVGCTPTKAMVASAYVAHLASRSREYGVVLEGTATVDMAAVRARADAIVGASRSGLERWISGMTGCTLIRGHARFESARTVMVEDRLITAEKIFIDVGCRPSVPDIKGLDTIPWLTSTDMLALNEIPRHLVIIGGSYVGLEFAQMFRRFGAQVTVIERSSRLIPREDDEVSAEVQSILESEGVIFTLGAECISVRPHADGVTVGINGAAAEIIGSHVLVAVGRRPNTDDLGLEKAGVLMSATGHIMVDERLATNVKGIWALGDCNGRGAFTHTAYNDFEIVAANLLDNAQRTVNDRISAYAMYIDPPLGRVGMTMAQALKAGRNIRIGKRPMIHVARALEKGESQGSMRIVVDADTEEILGAAILGPGGDEAIHMVLASMAAGARYQNLAHVMGIHPTVSELIPTILGELSMPSSVPAKSEGQDHALDEALDETFPSSDPIAVSITRSSKNKIRGS